MRQRLGIARCLIADPALLILDEPMNGLDPAGILEMRHLIRSFVDEGRTVLVSSHLLDEVERVCDSAVILVDGRVAAAGPLDELRTGVGGWYVEVETGTDQLADALRRAGTTVLRICPDGIDLLSQVFGLRLEIGSLSFQIFDRLRFGFGSRCHRPGVLQGFERVPEDARAEPTESDRLMIESRGKGR